MSMTELEEQGEIAKLSLPVSIKRDHIQGKSDARVTLVEYGDYECPYCGQAYMIVKGIQKQLKDQLRFVFRNFPLTQIHPHAQQTAEAAEAAGVQKKFWDMHDILYENQQALDYYHLVEYATIYLGTPTFFVNGVRYNDSWDYGTLLDRLLFIIKQKQY
jgi:protein-disulfide isomerase